MTEIGQKYFCDTCGNEVVVTQKWCRGISMLRLADGIDW